MKAKNLFIILGLTAIYFFSTGFVKEANPPVVPEKIDGASFAKFLSHFKKVEVPFQIDLEELEQYESQKIRKKISKKKRASTSNNTRSLMLDFIPELKKGYFSRMGPPEVLPIARFYPNPKSVAVVYMSYQPFGHRKISSYKLVLFDLKGKEIELRNQDNNQAHPIGFSLAHNSAKYTQTFSIDANGCIQKYIYENQWKKALNVKGTQDNEVLDHKLAKVETVYLKSDGTLVKGKDRIASRHASID